MEDGDVTAGTQRRQRYRDRLARLNTWFSFATMVIVILGALVALAVWISGRTTTWINDRIDARIAEQLKQPQAEIDRLTGRIDDMPSWLQFRFQVRSQSDKIYGGRAKSAPKCPEGWTEKAAFRISHKGGKHGHGGHVRLCIRAVPENVP